MIHSMSEKLEHKNNFGKREIYDYKKGVVHHYA